MQHKRSRTVLKFLLIGTGIAGMLIAALFGLAGVLGLLGVLADVGPDENRQWGVQALRIASVPFGLGVIALIGFFLIRKSGQTVSGPQQQN
jgi:hypothetical protein